MSNTEFVDWLALAKIEEEERVAAAAKVNSHP